MSTSIVRHLRGKPGIVVVAATAFLLVAGIGAATTALKDPPELTAAVAPAAGDSETVTRLKDYARSVGVGGSAPAAPAPGHAATPTTTPGKMLPDVNTMIDRLAARLEAAPDDIKGWRMLGWSYFHVERYKEAAAAFAKAVALDPASEELKRLHAQAKQAADADGSGAASTPPREVARTEPPHAGTPHAETRGPTPEQMKAMADMPADQRQASIRAMVDGLAARLESEPRDVEGWARLMRSRVVLGEKDVAASAFRKALDVFKDDAAAAARITAAAGELGLGAQ